MKKVITLILAIILSILECFAQSSGKRYHHKELVKTENKYNQKNFGFFGVLLGGLGTAIIRKKKITITKEGVILEE